MLCKYLNFSSNILVIDECFDNLDSSGCQQILTLISSISNIESIYIITHHTDISIPYDHEILVVKDIDGISHIK
jgi:DNA repair exonuclease SbcCD ATPase subunit